MGSRAPGEIELATWPDGMRAVRLLQRNEFLRLEICLGAGMPVPNVGWKARAMHLALLDADRAPWTMAQLAWASPGEEMLYVGWLGWRRPLSPTLRLRTLWVVFNELWWRPGCIELHPAVAAALGVSGAAPSREVVDALLDSAPDAWGVPAWDVEGYQLLQVPPPYTWGAEQLMKLVDAP